MKQLTLAAVGFERYVKTTRQHFLLKWGTRQGRAFDRGHQTSVRLCQGALSRAHQKHPSPAGDLRAGQFVYGAPVSLALQCRVICLTSRLLVAQPQIANQLRHLLQHCHWLIQFQWLASVRQPLVQTFLKAASDRAKTTSIVVTIKMAWARRRGCVLASRAPVGPRSCRFVPATL